MLVTTRRRILILLVLIVAILALFPGPPRTAHAATFTVDSTIDAVDANPGDGVCDDGSGNCTLRAAIMETNALIGADTITLPAGIYTISIPGHDDDAAETGDLDITDDLTINGAGADTTIIDGSGLDRVLDLLFGSSVDISGLTIRNGVATGNNGGGIFNKGFLTLTDSNITENTTGTGGGISNWGQLTLVNSTVSGNTSSDTGGGIYTRGLLALINTTISGNTSSKTGGGISLQGGGTVTVTSSTVSGNTSSNTGGGIYIRLGGTVTVTDSTVSGNLGASGGGIYSQGLLALINSTVSGNTSSNTGGGIYNVGGTIVVTNSTISGNASFGGRGGGINTDGGTITVTNSAIIGNSAADGGGIFNNGNALNMINSIVANSLFGGDCSGDGLTSLGHNLDSDGTCNLTDPTDLPTTDPMLGPLQDNGGPTLTHELLPGSRAIDAGDDSAAPAADQRGVSRPQGAASDIGAFEVEEPQLNPTNGHYYEAIVIRDGINWFDADAEAASRTFMGLQGHLATITSQNENEFIADAFPIGLSDYWLGGFQPPGSPEPDGGWQWVTGEPFEYTNWTPGEPDNGSDQDGLHFWQGSGQWDDDKRTNTNDGYVVEYEAIPGATCNDLPATIVGTEGDDVLIGTPGDDVIVGLGGNDTILGRGGRDVICGGGGDDYINGGPGNDWLFGGQGNDILRGGLGWDRLFGGPGEDTLRGGKGNDQLWGGPGHDMLGGGSHDDMLFGGRGNDMIAGHTGEDTIKCGPGTDFVDGGLQTDTADADCEFQVNVP